MWIKALVRVVFFAGVGVVIGCNRADGVRPRSNDGPGPGDSSNSEQEPTLKDADAYAARAYEWLCKGDYDRALKDYENALRLKPADAAFLNSRGFTWHMKSISANDRPTCEDRALSDYAEAIRINPKYASAINNRAWLWATSKVDRCRNGKQAVEEATKACELTGWKNPGYIDTLSVAYAEVGDFEQATRWQRNALENPTYKHKEGRNASEKLALFAKGQPFRE
jgi:tetratricopeptide (TPR) repeat protein